MKFFILMISCFSLTGCFWTDSRVRKALKTQTPYCNDSKSYCVKLIDLENSKVKALEIKIDETIMTLTTYDQVGDRVKLEDRYQYLVTGTVEPKTVDVQIVDVKGFDHSVCRAFCGDYGQDNSEVIQESYGTCICGNSEGKRVQEGYHRFINIKPEFKPGQCVTYMLTSSGATDSNNKLIGKPSLKLSKNLTYTIDSVDETEKVYYMTQIDPRFPSQKVRDMEDINNNYLRTKCPGEK